MNGMERLTDAAAWHGWDRQEDRNGWSSTVYWHRETSKGLQTVEVYRRADGGVTYGHRTWGARTNARAPKVADQVLTWMQEPTPDDETDRGFLFRLATSHGWTFEGITSGYVFRWGPRTGVGSFRITLRFKAAGVLNDAQRNFGGPGEVRSFHTNVLANITPWFHAFMDDDHECGCTPLARSLEKVEEGLNAVCGCTRNPLGHSRSEHPTEPVQEATKPVIRPAVPFRKQTHDEALHDRLSALQGTAQDVRAPWKGDSRKELDADVLWGVVSDLKRLQEEVTQAIVNAATLAAQRGADRA